ncbi:glycosyltransferase family 2 protein [Carboxydothermus pertinax]|uniref:Glucosyl-3-phosphoglycerate synthase n=1 Tax=Carboxydothermus pertinax TaxID=870242 RepID=A0A1L8CX77_9THEO|nr:glycosyltransferase family 2 protein [Carboxydothermus pertinax]GAV23474.1 glycosyl transferase family 2 [Carboxydothermus pertinax]
MTINVLIPAFNEEKNIGRVILALKKLSLIARIIVIDDGSWDGTANVARRMGVEVISLSPNQGKGAALYQGFKVSNGEIIAFFDADLINLTPGHILDLLLPVIKGEADMTIGVFSKGRLSTDLAQKVAPFLSGQRAFTRSFLENFFNNHREVTALGYGVEVALTLYAEKTGARVVEVPLVNLTHVMKEEKLGFFPGMLARAKMYREIVNSFGNKIKLG